jgi:hypothetical protein
MCHCPASAALAPQGSEVVFGPPCAPMVVDTMTGEALVLAWVADPASP